MAARIFSLQESAGNICPETKPCGFMLLAVPADARDGWLQNRWICLQNIAISFKICDILYPKETNDVEVGQRT